MDYFTSICAHIKRRNTAKHRSHGEVELQLETTENESHTLLIVNVKGEKFFSVKMVDQPVFIKGACCFNFYSSGQKLKSSIVQRSSSKGVLDAAMQCAVDLMAYHDATRRGISSSQINDLGVLLAKVFSDMLEELSEKSILQHDYTANGFSAHSITAATNQCHKVLIHSPDDVHGIVLSLMNGSDKSIVRSEYLPPKDYTDAIKLFADSVDWQENNEAHSAQMTTELTLLVESELRAHAA